MKEGIEFWNLLNCFFFDPACDQNISKGFAPTFPLLAGAAAGAGAGLEAFT